MTKADAAKRVQRFGLNYQWNLGRPQEGHSSSKQHDQLILDRIKAVDQPAKVWMKDSKGRLLFRDERLSVYPVEVRSDGKHREVANQCFSYICIPE